MNAEDRELLERAAKAAGFTIDWWRDGQPWTQEAGVECHWNPLEDDDEALRLAVQLDLQIDPGSSKRGFAAVRTGDSNWKEFREPHGTDINAAVRRAITRAAAA